MGDSPFEYVGQVEFEEPGFGIEKREHPAWLLRSSARKFMGGKIRKNLQVWVFEISGNNLPVQPMIVTIPMVLVRGQRT